MLYGAYSATLRTNHTFLSSRNHSFFNFLHSTTMHSKSLQIAFHLFALYHQVLGSIMSYYEQDTVNDQNTITLSADSPMTCTQLLQAGFKNANMFTLVNANWGVTCYFKNNPIPVALKSMGGVQVHVRMDTPADPNSCAPVGSPCANDECCGSSQCSGFSNKCNAPASVLVDVDFGGEWYNRVQVPDSDTCRNACYSDQQCLYHVYYQNFCYLKNDITNATSSGGRYSWFK